MKTYRITASHFSSCKHMYEFIKLLREQTAKAGMTPEDIELVIKGKKEPILEEGILETWVKENPGQIEYHEVMPSQK